MGRTRVKICGVTRARDAVAAANAGADAIGIVFCPTAGRYVAPDAAGEILAVLPPFVASVGLFLDASVQAMLKMASELSLAAVQLHGDESPETVAALAPLPVIKAIRVQPATFANTLNQWRRAIADLHLTNLAGIVLETGGIALHGGTGVANDWECIAQHIAAGDFAGLPPWIAAGGLRPDSVGDVVRKLRPWAVDVSSGVEERKREKSETLIRQFIDAVRLADAE